MTMRTSLSIVTLTTCLCIASVSPSLAASSSVQPGGYGPIRLGMPEADAKVALAGIAKDATALSMADLENYDPVALAKMVVAIPWEDTYVGTINPTTRIQFGVHAGHVVSVNLRSTLATQGKECRTAFAALAQRNQAEFGPIQVADVPSNPAAFTDGTATFAGWSLGLSRMEMEPGTCTLAADYTAGEDKDIETQWRASR